MATFYKKILLLLVLGLGTSYQAMAQTIITTSPSQNIVYGNSCSYFGSFFGCTPEPLQIQGAVASDAANTGTIKNNIILPASPTATNTLSTIAYADNGFIGGNTIGKFEYTIDMTTWYDLPSSATFVPSSITIIDGTPYSNPSPTFPIQANINMRHIFTDRGLDLNVEHIIKFRFGYIDTFNPSTMVESLTYNVLPRQPIISGITAPDVCPPFNINTSTLEFKVNTFTNAKVYVTTAPMPTTAISNTPTSGCTPLDANFPLCSSNNISSATVTSNSANTGASILIPCTGTAYPCPTTPPNPGFISVSPNPNYIPITNPGDEITIQLSGLAPGTYYISVLNVVSDPLAGAIEGGTTGSINRMFIVRKVNKLNGNYGQLALDNNVSALVAGTNGLPFPWPIVASNRPNSATLTAAEITSIGDDIVDRTVVVPVDNDLFISDFQAVCCPDVPPTGSITIGGKGGNQPFTLSVKKTEIPADRSITTYPAAVPYTSYRIPFTNGGTSLNPDYTWTTTLNDLDVGVYEVTVTDACNQSVTNIVVIKKGRGWEFTRPLVVRQPDCLNPANSGEASLTLKIKDRLISRDSYLGNGVTTELVGGWYLYSQATPTSPLIPINATVVSNFTNFNFNSNNNYTFRDDQPFAQDIPTNLQFSNLAPGNYVLYLAVITTINWGSVSYPPNYYPFYYSTGYPIPSHLYGFRGMTCAKSYSFTINQVPSLSVPPSQINVSPISCRGLTDGKIALSAAGTSSADIGYIYQLQELVGSVYQDVGATISALPNIEAVFGGLRQGSYKVKVMRQVGGCADMVLTSVISIVEPLDITTNNVTTTDISCSNTSVGDGNISGLIAGGTPRTILSQAYTYILESDLGGTGTFTPEPPINTSANFSIGGLGDGDYKIRIQDANGCSAYIGGNGSPTIFSIARPLSLEMTTLTFTDIKCFEDNGTITPTLTGGTPPYTYYAQQGASAPLAFVPTTHLFNAGTYVITAKDSRNCIADVTGLPGINTITISAPPAVTLGFTTTLSNYPGNFEVSCSGGLNGNITILATGGSGIYQYKLGATGVYQSNTLFSRLGAGIYTIFVKDSRDCERSNTVTLREPTIPLILTLGAIVNVGCANEATGSIAITASGGAGAGFRIASCLQGAIACPSPTDPSLSYTLITGATHNITGLRAGTYSLYLKDANDCTSMTMTAIVGSTYPVVTANFITSNVSCFGGNDGSIVVTPTQGTAPFTYTWADSNIGTASRSNLVARSYTVEVKDFNNCKENFTYTITQPTALVVVNTPASPALATQVACDRQSNGKITLNPTTVSGGTSPYSYSKDNGTTWQPSNIFAGLAPANYTIKVKDDNNCIVTLPAVAINSRGDNPKEGFLVATRQNALDTLVLITTSYPEPTDITWVFDTRATVISNINNQPHLRFPEAGNYTVAMTANYNGCYYTVTKTLQISAFDAKDPGTAVGIRPITSVTVAPNPNSGDFNLTVVLAKKQYVHAILINVLGTVVWDSNPTLTPSWGKTLLVDNAPISIPNLTPGAYSLRVVTDNDIQVVNVIIN